MNTKVPFASRVVAPYLAGVGTMLFALPENEYRTFAVKVYEAKTKKHCVNQFFLIFKKTAGDDINLQFLFL